MEAFCPWKIRKLAQEKHISQEALSKACDVDRSTLNRWLNGHQTPNADYLPLIAKKLGCTVADFFDDVPDDWMSEEGETP